MMKMFNVLEQNPETESLFYYFQLHKMVSMRNQNNVTRVIKNMKKIQEVRGGNN